MNVKSSLISPHHVMTSQAPGDGREALSDSTLVGIEVVSLQGKRRKLEVPGLFDLRRYIYRLHKYSNASHVCDVYHGLPRFTLIWPTCK